MSENAVVEKVSKPKTEYTEVAMEDGTTFKFPGTRLVDKTYEIDEAAGTVTNIFRFRNGAVRKVVSTDLSVKTQLTAYGHGVGQKVGDEWSDAMKKNMSIEDIVMTCDEMIARLKSGDWTAQREAGDSMAGAHVVVQAILEDRKNQGKPTTVEKVKEFLNARLEAAKAKGEKLSRQDLYASFRKPGSRTAVIIERLEKEKLSKEVKVDADSLLDEIPS